MSKLLQRLLGYLFPGVDDADLGADPAEDPAADPGADPATDPDPADELDIDFEEDEPAPAPVSARERLARLEAEVERRGRAVDQPRTPTAPPVDTEFQREEERLRAGDITEQERWQIQSNRVLRENQRLANQALFQAQDMSDRTQYESKVATDPRRAKYRDRVEQAVQEERRQGRNASREAVYYYMLGKDIADGKLKPKAKTKAPAADVPRGKPANVRSNVPVARGATEHQKRAARLADVNI
jgi:hypothetical protein